MRPAADGADCSVSSSTAPRSSPGVPGQARAKFAATCWKTTLWKPSSACPPICSTTPASAPTSGSSATQAAARKAQGAIDRRQQLLAENAQEPGQQAQGTESQHIDDITRLFGEFKKPPATACRSAVSSTMKTSATVPSPSSAPSAQPVRSSWAARARQG